MRFAALSVAAAAIVLTQTAHATDPESLNVQGIELGMLLDDTRTELVGRGYEKTIGNEPAAFDDIVKKALDEITGPVPKGGLMRFETRTEIVILQFVALPEGPEVTSITYRLNDPLVSYANLSETVIGLYGKPDFKRTSLCLTPDNLPRLYWLASPPTAAHGAPGGAFLELAYSKSSGESEFHSGQIMLQDGGARQKRQTREIEDAVRKVLD